MAQLWGGRFEGEINELAWKFNASIYFDKRLIKQDVQGSKAHVTMLAKQGIITDGERDQIISGLDSIIKDVEEGKLEYRYPNRNHHRKHKSSPRRPSST